MSHDCEKRRRVTNRILDDDSGDQRREDAAYGRDGVRESHERPGEVRAEVHVVDVVAAESGDVAGHGDDEDAHGQFRLVLPHVTQPDQRDCRDPVSDRVADLPGHFRRHDVPPDAQIGYVTDRKADDPRRQIGQRRHHTVLQSKMNNIYPSMSKRVLIRINK